MWSKVGSIGKTGVFFIPKVIIATPCTCFMDFRWFVLDSDTGTFEYFLLDDGPAGRQVVSKDIPL